MQINRQIEDVRTVKCLKFPARSCAGKVLYISRSSTENIQKTESGRPPKVEGERYKSMAGKRHHIIPRFLMKGFASRVDGDEVFTWVYRKDASPFQGDTKNINVEKHFYGNENEEINADDIITDLEINEFSPLIDKLRNSEGNVDFLSKEIADLFSHLIIRTKNFRSSISVLLENISLRLDEYLTNPINIEKVILNQPFLFRNEFEKIWQVNVEPFVSENLKLLEANNLNSQKINAEKEKLFQQFIKKIPAQLKDDLPQFTESFSNFFSSLKTNLIKAIRNAHNKHLNNKPISNKVEQYSKLKWFVITTNAPLILGDAGCIFEVISKRKFKVIDDDKESLVNAFLPLTSKKLLIGTKYQTAQNIDIKLLNKATAYCSYDCFISSENTPDKLKLSKDIGKWAFLLADDELEYYINKMFQDFEAKDSLIES